MEVKNRELINTSTDWMSPTSIEELLDSNNTNDWINLDNLMNWENNEYAVVEKGVRKNVPSRPFQCSGFNIIIDKEEYIINTIEIRMLVINDTQGGTSIKDYDAKICGKRVFSTSIYWREDFSELRTYSLNYSEIENLNDIIFEYSCIGTGTDYQIPQIYGIQCRVLYSYYEDKEVNDLPQYEVKASLDDYELLSDNTTTILTLNRFTINGMSGLFGNVYINLSDNLVFNDNTNKKIIKAVNTNNVWSAIDKFTIRGTKQGLGKITISSSSMNEIITLYLNIDNDIYYNENMTILENNTFNLCNATELGGAIYNNSYLNNINPYYNDNSAIEGQNIYDALTIINTSLDDEYELGVVHFSCEVSFQNQSKTVNYGYVKLYDNGIEIDSAEVDNNGNAIFEHNFETIGEHNLKFQYINKNFNEEIVDHHYGNSTLRKTIKITKKIPKIYLIDENGNEIESNSEIENINIDEPRIEDYHKLLDTQIIDIQQNTHMLVKLLDKDTLEPLTDTVVEWNDKKYITDELGIAYLMVMEPIGYLKINVKFNGDDIYEPVSLLEIINVTLRSVQIISNDLYTRENVNDNYTVKLLDVNGNPLVDKSLYIYMENTIDKKGIKDYKYSTSQSGSISIPIKLHKGIWVTTNTFESDGKYRTTRTYNNVICYDDGMTETKIVLNETTIQGIPFDNVTVSGTLLDVIAQSGLKRDLQIIVIDKINNLKTYKQFKSDIYGNFSIDLELKKGEYVFQVVFLGDKAYDGCLESGNISILNRGTEPSIIQSTDYKGKYSAIDDFKIILSDEDNNPLANRKILFNFKKSNKDWFDYETYTNEKGEATYSLGKLDFGAYLVKTSFLGDENYLGTTNKNVVIITYGNDVLKSLIRLQSKTLIKENDVEKYRFTFVLTDENNSPLTNQYCNIITYNEYGYIDNTKVVTNSNGGFYIDLGTESQLLVIEGIYPGSNLYTDYQFCSVYFQPKYTVKSTEIKCENVELFEGENKYYSAVLVDAIGNPISNKYICTEIIHSDKSTEAIYNLTDESGEIRIELDNFSPDIYTFKSYYSGGGKENYSSSKCENTVKINQNENKIPTVIVGGSKEYTYRQANEILKYEIELTAGVLGNLNEITRSIPLNNKSITFLVENLNTKERNTYVALTDSNGRAYISIKDWVGEFKITYTFLGDFEYAQSEETSLLTITATEELPSIIEAYDTEVKFGENKNINLRLMSTLPIDINIVDEGIPIANAELEIDFINRITQEEYLVNSNIDNPNNIYAQITNSQGRIKFGLLTDNNGLLDENKQNFFKTGIYDVIIKFLGNNSYQPCEKIITLTILEKDDLEKVYLTPINKKMEIDINGNERMEEYLNISSIKMSVNDSSILIVRLESQAINNRPVIYEDGNPVHYIEGDYVLLDFYDRANKRISYTVKIEEKELEYDNNLHSIIEFDCAILEGGVYDCYISYPTQTYWEQDEPLRIQVEVIPKIPTLVLLNENNVPVDSLSFKYTTNSFIKVGLFYEDRFSQDTINLYGREINIKWLDNEYLYFVYNGVSYSGITGQGDLDIENTGITGVAQLSLQRIEGLKIGENQFSVYNLTTNNVESNVLNFIIDITSEDGAYLSGFNSSSDSSIIYYGLSRFNYNHINNENIINLNLYYDEYSRGGVVTRQIPISNVQIVLSYWYYDNSANNNKKIFTLTPMKTNADGLVSFRIPIPPTSKLILTNEKENPSNNGEYYIYLEITVNSNIYLNKDGSKIVKNGYLRIRKRDIIFNDSDYSYANSTVIFSFSDNQYPVNPNNSKREGDLVIDIDKR